MDVFIGVLSGVLLPLVGIWITMRVLSVDKIIAAAQNDEASQ